MTALIHARTPVDLGIEEHPFCLVVVVHDDSSARPLVRAPTASETGGRGLLIVSRMCVDWGVDMEPDGGRSVWVMFALRPPSFTTWLSGV